MLTEQGQEWRNLTPQKKNYSINNIYITLFTLVAEIVIYYDFADVKCLNDGNYTNMR